MATLTLTDCRQVGILAHSPRLLQLIMPGPDPTGGISTAGGGSGPDRRRLESGCLDDRRRNDAHLGEMMAELGLDLAGSAAAGTTGGCITIRYRADRLLAAGGGHILVLGRLLDHAQSLTVRRYPRQLVLVQISLDVCLLLPHLREKQIKLCLTNLGRMHGGRITANLATGLELFGALKDQLMHGDFVIVG